MTELPAGTVTFLFTDLEGSMRLWQEHPVPMKAASARHDELLRDAVVGHDGHVFTDLEGSAMVDLSLTQLAVIADSSSDG